MSIDPKLLDRSDAIAALRQLAYAMERDDLLRVAGTMTATRERPTREVPTTDRSQDMFETTTVTIKIDL